MKFKITLSLMVCFFSVSVSAKAIVHSDGLYIHGRLVNEYVTATFPSLSIVLKDYDDGSFVLLRRNIPGTFRETCLYKVEPKNQRYFVDSALCTDTLWDAATRRFRPFMYAHQFESMPIETFRDSRDHNYSSQFVIQKDKVVFSQIPVLTESGKVTAYLNRCELYSRHSGAGLRSFLMESVQCDEPDFQFMDEFDDELKKIFLSH